MCLAIPALITEKKSDNLATAEILGVTLTEDGYRYGAAVFERHELLRKFLTKVLGIPEDTAEEEACLMEHAISDESFKKWNSYIKQLDL